MTHFINTRTMQHPVYEGQIKYEHGIDANLTYPEYELPAEYALVKVAEEPPYDPSTQTVDSVFPTLIDGEWTLTWTVRELLPEERERFALFKKYVDEGQVIEPPKMLMLVNIN